MKKLIIGALLLISFGIQAQELTQNEKNNRYEYTEVFEVPDATAEDIYKNIKANYIALESIIQSDEANKKIVIRYQFQINAFKHGKITETFDIKEGKLRWKAHSVEYLKAVTAASKWNSLDETGDAKILKKVNELLPMARKGIVDKVVNATNADDEPW